MRKEDERNIKAIRKAERKQKNFWKNFEFSKEQTEKNEMISEKHLTN